MNSGSSSLLAVLSTTLEQLFLSGELPSEIIQRVIDHSERFSGSGLVELARTRTGIKRAMLHALSRAEDRLASDFSRPIDEIWNEINQDYGVEDGREQIEQVEATAVSLARVAFDSANCAKWLSEHPFDYGSDANVCVDAMVAEYVESYGDDEDIELPRVLRQMLLLGLRGETKDDLDEFPF